MANPGLALRLSWRIILPKENWEKDAFRKEKKILAKSARESMIVPTDVHLVPSLPYIHSAPRINGGAELNSFPLESGLAIVWQQLCSGTSKSKLLEAFQLLLGFLRILTFGTTSFFTHLPWCEKSNPHRETMHRSTGRQSPLSSQLTAGIS